MPDVFTVSLEKEGLHISNIDWVVCSHSHGDHRKNSNLFPKDKVYNPFKLYKKIPEDLVILGTEIRVIHMPGHVDNHIAFISATPEGRCGIATDVIWWADHEEQKTDMKSLVEHVDVAAKDMAQMMETRWRFYAQVECISKIFKLPMIGISFYQNPRRYSLSRHEIPSFPPK